MDVKQIPAAWREQWEERAAIMEYEGGLPRDEAERLALNLLQAALVLLANEATQRQRPA